VWRFHLTGAAVLIVVSGLVAGAAVGGLVLQSSDPTGQIRTADIAGPLDTGNPSSRISGPTGGAASRVIVPTRAGR
jgi:hypothetical protein